MPLHDYKCPNCGHIEERFLKIADLDTPQGCPQCIEGVAMTRQLAAPRVRGDYAGYDCPITGNWIEGRVAHQENLARHGCRVFEPGERQEAQRRISQDEAALDAKIEQTAEQFYEALPTQKREQLGQELTSGVDVAVVRQSIDKEN